ncbi:AAA family ATPase [Prevotella copri]|uniref:AAA family ATPase n=1 Tax=Segatella copri TaxID=165179 RepID=A0AAP3B9Z0_9BACT|nr:AAA family ATPase [Segatella copri]MCW4126990.1 AAA family ATPase [Segatella copri]MCW4413954.1 AAA family ATPase [Segatella copri]MCW4420709.1 AAA family ATPase [Segatella copri]
MEDYDKLMIGDQSVDGRLLIADKDRLCYQVKLENKGAFSIRTISKQLLGEFIDYYRKNPDKKAEDARVELKELSNIDKFEYGYSATLTAMAKMVLDPKNELIRKGIPTDSFSTESSLLKAAGLQQIYYGAPGTGKSKAIKDLTFGEDVIRTTFHPDSDYASFVGTYKPITEEVDFRDCYGKKVIDDETKEVVKEERIAYKFIPQAFLEAYVKAWKKLGSGKKQYLIIEEINRGNCAQIFGDLFQLLDRNEYGFSDYPIVADKDMQKYLEKEFEGWEITNKDEINQLYGEANMVNLIMKGERLVLPSNLYIWATMNTSDQSLFPIDSAFKRRWDWKYVSISEGRDKATNAPLNWYINTGDKQYNWWSFISKVNKLIGSLTNSEDKKLGYFFCKAKDGEIDADLFVSKVIFYLWNDVFKDYGFDDKDFQDEEGKILSFDRFYEDANGVTNINVANVELFLENLGVDEFISDDEEEYINANEDEENEDSSNSTISSPSSKREKYSINNSGAYRKCTVPYEAIKLYSLSHPSLPASTIIKIWSALNIKHIPHLIESEQDFERREQNSKDAKFRDKAKKITINNETVYISNQFNPERIKEFIQKVNAKDWGINIKEIDQ